ncbi:hypothetical protein ABPG74_008048 [Tetrahymena malaccensis]
MRQFVSEIQKGNYKQNSDSFDKSYYKPQIQNEQILHSKVARFLILNPTNYPYGKINNGKIQLKQDEDPWISIRPQTTDQNSRKNYYQELQSIAKQTNQVSVKMRSKSLNQAKQLNIENLTKLKQKQINPKLPQEKILVSESSVYPQIFFSKTKLRHLLKQVDFPQNAKVLDSDDTRIQVIFQIVSKIFNEIPLYIFNLIICQRQNTNNFVIFFEDPEQIPFSKCCNSPIQVDLQESGVGMIVCNNAQCQENILVQFLISFDDSVKLWKHKRIFKQASERDNYMRMKISNMISTGKYKHHSLKKEIEKASQEITQIFTYQDLHENERKDKFNKYNSNNNNYSNTEQIQNKDQDDLINQQQYNDLFMTNLYGIDSNNPAQNKKASHNSNQQDLYTLNDDLDQIDQINANIQKNFIQQNELNTYKQKISQGLVQNSTVFNKNFYSYITNQNSNQGLFDKQNNKVRMIRKPRLIKSSQIPVRKIQKLKEQQQQLMSLNLQNNFMLSQENQNYQNYQTNI